MTFFSEFSWCCWVNFGINLLSSCLQYCLLSAAIIVGFILIPAFMLARGKFRNQKLTNSKYSVGLFHPYCNAGGGGERVLWCALKALIERYPSFHYVIYTGDVNVTREQFLNKVNSNFNITFAKDVSIEFIYLKRRRWVEASKYPHFTLLGQSLGSVWLGFEAISLFIPDLYIDTMGYTFVSPIFKYLGRSKIGCYTHYPTISTDMLSLVSSRAESYNNDSVVVKSPVLSKIKLIYYQLFAWLYSFIGHYSNDIVMVNSSWTLGHINALWKCPNKTYKIYPPCNTKEFQAIQRTSTASYSGIKLLSIAQFRPEKNYPLQIETLAVLKEVLSSDIWSKIQLVCIGSCRDQEDFGRVEELKNLAVKLNVAKNVVFKINVSFDELKKEMSEGMIGLHTMWNEHFGIGIVESMAAGLIMVANNSGGPKMDIIDSNDTTKTGFLASTKNEYADCIKEIINMSEEERDAIRKRARVAVERFSDTQFNKEFINTISQIIQT